MTYIKTVMRFWNGMVAAFDEEGQQIPEFQGRWEDVASKIYEQREKQEYKFSLEGLEESDEIEEWQFDRLVDIPDILHYLRVCNGHTMHNLKVGGSFSVMRSINDGDFMSGLVHLINLEVQRVVNSRLERLYHLITQGNPWIKAERKAVKEAEEKFLDKLDKEEIS